MFGIKRKEICFLRKNGKKFYSNIGIFLYTTSDKLSLAVSVSKKIGNACFRNKIRRRCKEIFRISNIVCKVLIITNIQNKDFSFKNLKTNIDRFIDQKGLK